MNQYSINELVERSFELEPSYNLRPLRGCYYNHIPELASILISAECDFNVFYFVDFYNLNDKVSIRYLKDYADGRKVWVVGIVFYYNSPVMLFQNAGREGDDHYSRYIIDQDAYYMMVGYLLSLVKNEKISNNYDVNIVVEDLNEKKLEYTNFYYSSVDDTFDE